MPAAHPDAPLNLPAILIANGLGICLLLVLLFSKRHPARPRTLDGRLFYGMCWLNLALCVVETLSFMLDGTLFWGARALAILANCLLFFLNAVFSFAWVCYVDYKLCGSTARLRRMIPRLAAPAAILCLLAFANLFFPVFFEISPENIYTRQPLVLINYLVTYFYLTCGAVLVWRQQKKLQKYLFMPVLLFLLPIYLGSLLQLFHYGIALIWVSVALGLTSLYINLQNEESYLDALTGLYNRNYLIRYLNYLSERSRKAGPIQGILLDINQFKQINDTYSHAEGDRVLCLVGQILRRCVSPKTVVARYGGDEFVILLENAPPSEAQRVRERLAQELARCNAESRAPYRLSLSLGTAAFTSEDLDGFLRAMDDGMYAEKRAFYQKQQAACPPD